jgi:nucleoid-associated protein YgaU
VGGGICAPLSVGNAVRRTGQRFLLSLDEIAQAHGLPDITSVHGLDMKQSITALRRLGTAFEEIPAAGSLKNLSNTAERGGGVVMFRVVDSKTGEGHRILLEKAGAVVRIVDRTGFYQSLEELSGRYGRIFVVDPAAPAVFLKNAMSKLLNGLPTLMIYANGLTVRLTGNKTLPELDAKFREFKSQKGASAGRLGVPGGKTVTVSPGETLSGLARKHYGTSEYWPLLWDNNRGAVGPNPNAIRPGMVLQIPALVSFTPAQLQNAKQRFATWRNY